MTLYEYSRQECSRKIELLIRGDEKPKCLQCGTGGCAGLG